MAFTANDIAALKAAIATGAQEVEFEDGRRVKYRSLAEMRSVLTQMEAEVTPAPAASRVTYSEFHRD